MADAGAEGHGEADGTFVSLRVPAFRRLWTAGICQFGAIAMEGIARGFLAFDLTGRNAALGITLLAMGVPMLLMTPFGGVAADRFPKRAVVFVATGLLWVASVAIALALLTDVLAFWMLVTASVVQGAAYSLTAPARVAFSYELVGRERLGNAILLSQLSMNGTRVVGPAAAGVVLGIPWLGAGAVYVVSSLLMSASLALTFRLPKGVRRPPSADGVKASPLQELAAGVRYVRSEPTVLWPVLMGIGLMSTAFPYVAFLPALVDEVFAEGPGWLGALSTVSAVGAMAASLGIARVGASQVSDGTVTVVALGFAGAVIALGAVPTVEWALGVVLVAGAGNAAFQALNNAVVLVRSREEFHGRVQSLLMLGWSAFGIFAFPLGAIADAVGLRTTLVGMGTLAVATTVLVQVATSRSAAGAARAAVADAG